MKRIIYIGLTLLLASVFQTSVSKLNYNLFFLVNFLSIFVVHWSMNINSILSTSLGTIAGLVQDSFSTGIIGVSGLSKGVMGYLISKISSRIITRNYLSYFLIILTGVLTELLIYLSVLHLINLKISVTERKILLLQPFITAVLGGFVFYLIGKWKK
ncbi:MAG: rod shape-determining protein MreD [Acidobacteriota bacterium]